MPKKPFYNQDDYFKQLDEMLKMPAMGTPQTLPGSLLTRIRQGILKKTISRKPRV